MAPAKPLQLLRDAIDHVARLDPERVALTDGYEARTYRELARLIGERGVDERPRREVLRIAGTLEDAEHIVRDACAGNSLSVLDLSRTLAGALPAFAPRLPRRELPDWMVKALSMIRPELGRLRRDLGLHKQMSNAKARRILDWHPRPNGEAILETARSLVRLGLVTPPDGR